MKNYKPVAAIAVIALMITGAAFARLRVSPTVKSAERGNPSPPPALTGEPQPAQRGKKAGDTSADPNSKALDESIHIISESRCWQYQEQDFSIEGKPFKAYATLDHTCSGGDYITFDVARWSRFEGYLAISAHDERSNLLTIKADDKVVAEHQLNYGKNAIPIHIDLHGRQTLSFKKSGRYPEVVVCEPKLFR